MSMTRSVFVSGCHVCPSIMAKPITSRQYLVPPLIQWSLENGIDIIKMRCPETEFVGANRKPAGRAYYDRLEGFREACVEIAIYEAERMLRNGRVIAVIGVTTSPACGTNFEGKNVYQPSGIYMEELYAACTSLGLTPYSLVFGISTDIRYLRTWLRF